VSEKELQEKIMVYRIVESRIDALIKQRDLFLNKIMELQNTLASIDEIAKSNQEILFPIGSEAYSFGKVTETNKIIVEIGAGIALEKNFDEAKEIIVKRKNDIQTTVREIQADIQKLSQSLSSLEFEIQSLAQSQEESKEAG
jgi:prefoldin alpha subunit